MGWASVLTACTELGIRGLQYTLNLGTLDVSFGAAEEICYRGGAPALLL